MSKHTPGPWIEGCTPNGNMAIYQERGKLIVGLPVSIADEDEKRGWITEETLANARLIALAPRVAEEHAEMADLIKRVIEYLPTGDRDGDNVLVCARALLARIEEAK